MTSKMLGAQTVRFDSPPCVAASACAVGTKEGLGPLADSFDYIFSDDYMGEKTWEKAEAALQKKAFSIALSKYQEPVSNIRCVFAGDLLNQCTASSGSLKERGIPFFGLYGACSTMAEAAFLAAAAVDGGYAEASAAVTSSHFCSAERQFRSPLEYGAQRPPTSQWTVTGAGALIVSANGNGPYITHGTAGIIRDAGVKDANSMGSAMALAAYETLSAHFADTGFAPGSYDLIVTGDLGRVGHEILCELFARGGTDIAPIYRDCGMMIYDSEAQDTHAGGSGCGCSASVLCGLLLNGMRAGRWNRMLFAATGALMSPTSVMQGENILGICHAISFSTTK